MVGKVLVSVVALVALPLSGCAGGISGDATPESPPPSRSATELGVGQVAFGGGEPTAITSCENITLDTAANVFNLYARDGMMVQVETDTTSDEITRVAQADDTAPQLTEANGAAGRVADGEVAGTGTFDGDATTEFRFAEADCASNPGGSGERSADDALPNGLTAPDKLAINTVQFEDGPAVDVSCAEGESTGDKTEFILNGTGLATDVGVTFDFKREVVTAVRVMDDFSTRSADSVFGSGAKGYTTGWADFDDESSAVAFAFDNTGCTR